MFNSKRIIFLMVFLFVLAPVVAMASVTLTLTAPSTTTVSQGSQLGPFTASIANNSGSRTTLYVYVWVGAPDGSSTTVVSNKMITLRPYKTISKSDLYYDVSSTAQAGTYSYYMAAYDTSYNLIDDGYFWFEVTGQNKVLVLARNASSLDSEETKVTDFLTQNGYQYDLADSSTITGGLNVSSYKVIYFRTGSEPTGYNSTSVLTPIQNAVEGGSSLIVEYYGNYLAKYLGWGSITSGGWYPAVYDKLAYVKSITSHEIFNGISTWDPPTEPDKDEQLIWSLTKTGSYTCKDLSLTSAQNIEYWELWMTYGWNGQSADSTYCQSWGGCTSDRSVRSNSIRYATHGSGKVIHPYGAGIGSSNCNDSRILGTAGTSLMKNILNWACGTTNSGVTYLINDDFESYTSGTFPSSGGWYERYNGTGNNIIDTTHAYSGTKAFRLQGYSNWAVNIENHNAGWQNSSSYMGYELYVYPQQGQSASSAFYDYYPLWGGHWGRVFFDPDGYIYGDNGSSMVQIMSFTTDQWYKVKAEINSATGAYEIWVNDVSKGNNFMSRSQSDSSYSQSDSYFMIEGGGSSSNYFWVDDVKVWYK